MLASDLRIELGRLAIGAELRVEAGECLAIAGPSGAGKSTLLGLIAGLRRPDRGRLELEGRVLADPRAGVAVPPEQRRVGYLFQEYALFGHLSARANVAYGIRDRRRAERRRRAGEWLERFGVAARADARPRELSGGERQRVALARALASEPRALLLDEPLSALDTRTRRAATGELAATLAELGVPAVIVTHEFAEAALLADRVAILDRGRVVQAGTAAELAASPASPLVADLAGAVVLRGRAREGGDGLTVVVLDGGGGEVRSVDRGAGPVAASVFPWEISLGPPGPPPEGSALNHLLGTVVSVTEFGNRARVAIATPQPLVAELTAASAHRLGLEPGVAVEATWKATATRIAPGR